MSTLNVTSITRQPAEQGSKAVSDFDLKQNSHGSWVVTIPGDHWGGIFLTRDAALKFAREELGEAALDPRTRGAERAA